MKTCPRCGKSYNDDNLNYCLDDGSELVTTGHPQATAAIGGNPTVLMPGAAGQPTWNMPPPATRRSSRALPWVVGIVGTLAIICASGIGGLIYIGSRAPRQDVNIRQEPTPQPSSPANSTTTPDNDDLDNNDQANVASVTQDQYDKINVGMARSDVEQIMGGRGSELYKGEGGGMTFATVSWADKKYHSIIITFKNNKVMNKTQVGLDPSKD